ncbi:MAG: hypothetical protein ACFFAO_10990 [Candidatus Hermodarchaeota archaeon]
MNGKIEINQIIINSANAALKNQSKEGYFPSGHNGPWSNNSTAVRTTSHWAILFLKAYELTNEENFRKVAEKAYNYLTTKQVRPYNYSFHCIYSENKVKEVNGLIGQAWVIESLLEANNYLSDSIYLKIAEDVILKHYFNKDLGLWHVLGLRGEKLKINRILNQQIWFTLMAFKVAKLCNNHEILASINIFLDNLPSFINFKKYIRMRINENVVKTKKSPLKNSTDKIKTSLGKYYITKRSKGYLSFSLLALAELYLIENSLNVWNNPKFKKMVFESIKYLDNVIYNDDKNEFGFQYNPIGFEVPYIKQNLSDYLGNYLGRSIEEWILKQLKNHYNFEKMMMIENTSDQDTLASRIYEITKLRNLELLIK